MDHRTSLATESLDRLASREGVAESVGGASEKKGIIAIMSIMLRISVKNSLFVLDTQNRKNSSITK